MIFNYKRRAKKLSYKNGYKRNLKDVKAIVIHSTYNKTDTAKNNADFFATGNTRYAGAHIFTDQTGKTALSVPLNRVAWSVGDKSGMGAFYELYNNINTVSIEMCSCQDNYINDKQLAALKKVIKYVKKKCPNVENIVRHYDITTKACPTMYQGTPTKNNQWVKLKAQLLPLIKGV